MAKVLAKRNVGMEILKGLRQLKRGEVGRVVNLPSLPRRAGSNRPDGRSPARSLA